MRLYEFEQELETAAELMAARGQAGRYPVRRLASHLRQQGFLPTQHFLDRLRERAQARGIRFEPRLFGNEFYRARHYRQTRPGYHTRIALMRGLPIVYRMGGENANRVVLVGLLPEGGLPPVAPTIPPRPRQREAISDPYRTAPRMTLSEAVRRLARARRERATAEADLRRVEQAVAEASAAVTEAGRAAMVSGTYPQDEGVVAAGRALGAARQSLAEAQQEYARAVRSETDARTAYQTALALARQERDRQRQIRASRLQRAQQARQPAGLMGRLRRWRG